MDLARRYWFEQEREEDRQVSACCTRADAGEARSVYLVYGKRIEEVAAVICSKFYLAASHQIVRDTHALCQKNYTLREI